MYETGVLIAFLLLCWQLVMVIVNANSQLNRNLNRVGMQISWWTYQAEQIEPKHLTRPFWRSALKFLAVAFVGLISIWLSWLHVALVAGMWIHAKSKDSGAPASVKEFRWKMKNRDMSIDDYVRGLMVVQEIPSDQFEQQRSAVVELLRARGFAAS